jgi:hypothetical protein
MKTQSAKCGLILLGALLGAGGALAYESLTPKVQQKFEQIERVKRTTVDQSTYGDHKSPIARTAQLRDSGHTESLMFVSNTNFRFVGDIGFYVPRLTLSLHPNDPASPVVFDDPTSFYLKPHDGEVVLTSRSLGALFNDHVFKFERAPLKNLKLATAPGQLTLSGQLYRNKWIPFVMKGPIKLEQGHMLLFTPNFVEVDGVEATKVLPAANVKLDELLKVEAVGVKLIGNTIQLDARQLFPPPKLDLTIKEARLEARGLVLSFADGLTLEAPQSRQNAKSYMIVKGGDVKFMRTMPVNVLLEMTSKTVGEELDFCLYRYREQVAGGWLKFATDGGIFGYLQNCGTLAKKGAQP